MSWGDTCQPKKFGGMGIRNIEAWNKPSIEKLIWAVAIKKDLLWVRWVHGTYLAKTNWWDYTPRDDICWY